MDYGHNRRQGKAKADRNRVLHCGDAATQEGNAEDSGPLRCTAVLVNRQTCQQTDKNVCKGGGSLAFPPVLGYNTEIQFGFGHFL